MPATLYFSNSPAILLDKLSGNLEWTDPFDPPRIATPTPAMRRWVQMRLAEKRGIVANVGFQHLENTLWRRLEELDQEHVAASRQPARLLDDQAMQLLILGLLRRNPPPEAREYLQSGKAGEGSADSGLFSRRLCQLSHKLAGLFREYEYSRVREHGYKGLAYLWKHGEDCFREYAKGASKADAARLESLERWQKAIYHALFQPGGWRDAIGEQTGQYRYTLPQYAEMVLAQQRRAIAQEKLPSYHLFGLSQISPFHRSLIKALSDAESLPGREATFFIYSLNPCAEYWEDALTPGELRIRRHQDAQRRRKYADWRQLNLEEKRRLKLEIEDIQKEELHLQEDDHPLLSQWGRPGRENVQLWNQITDYDFLENFREAPGTTLLAAVQNALLHRRGKLEEDERIPQDSSLRIFACPEIHREAETAHADIADSLLRDPDLRPDEIAVLVPDMDKYRPVLASVFGLTSEGRSGHVPYNFSDLHASGESEYARGIRSLFNLARDRFGRVELLELAGNACFRRALQLGDDAPGLWSYWVGTLNVFHCFDEEDKRSRGYSSDPVHTWMHGLRRLLLGTVMETPPLEDGRNFDAIVPYADAASRDCESLQGFLLAVEKLHLDLRPWRDGRELPWSAWVDSLTHLFDAYLAISEDAPADAYVRAQVQRYLSELRGMDVMEEAGAGVPGEIPMELTLAYLDGLQAAGHPHLSGGVNIAPLQSLRSIPFKLIYVLGLGEGEFPDAPDASILDLRRQRRVIGDVDPAMRNRYLLLETLICGTEKVCLSYVCRDAREGKVFQPGSALNELTDYLQENVLPAKDGNRAEFQSVVVPMLSRDFRLFPADGARDAAGEVADATEPLRNHSREERLLSWLERKKEVFLEARGEMDADLAGRTFLAYLQTKLPRGLAREIFPPMPAAPVEAAATTNREKISIADMARFLRNPVEYTLRKEMGIYGNKDEDDPLDSEDEPFFSGFPWKYHLPESAFHARLADWKTLQLDESWSELKPGFDAMYENLSRRGIMPESWFGELDREDLWEKTGKGLTSMEAVLSELRGDPREFKLLPGVSLGEGDGRSQALQENSFPPVILENVAGRTVELHGYLAYLFRPSIGGGCAALAGIPYDFKPKHFLPSFLFYAAASLSQTPLGDWARSGSFTIRHHGKKNTQAGYAFTNETAEAYLRLILEAMLKGGDMDLLPFEAVADKPFLEKTPEGRHELRPLSRYSERLRDALAEAEENEHSSYKPGNELTILAPSVPTDAKSKVFKRLELFFNGMEK